jgi:large subunit ribosomal protein L15
MPLIRRIPKRGFNNTAFKVSYLPVNLDDLNSFDEGSVVDAEVLRVAGVAKGPGLGVKILGTGELTKRLVVKAAAFSVAARTAIEKLGGTAELVS